uniref:Uncharacterized protein n=1 Tax=Helianthus annuus TaxID=4232 RepID=A0A251VGF4_HELAN
MRYYASTLNRFSTRSTHWSATRLNMLSERTGCSIEYATRSSDILLRTTTEVPNRSVKPTDRTDRSNDRPERPFDRST